MWCSAQSLVPGRAPVPGDTYESALGIDRPTAPTGEAEGPATEWFSSGALKSHGHYAHDANGQAVPHGVWTFWREDGSRRAQVRYHQGTPVGCAGLWDDSGALTTYAPGSSGMTPSLCPLAIDHHADLLIQDPNRLEPTSAPAAHWSAEVTTLWTPQAPAVESSAIELPDVSIGARNLGLSIRHHFPRFAAGIALGHWMTDERHHSVSHAGALVATTLPLPIDRLAVEVSGELGGKQYRARGRLLGNVVSSGSLLLPYVGLRTGLQIRLARWAELTVAGQVHADWEKKIDRTYEVCATPLNCALLEATWRTGGTTLAAVGGLRFHWR